MNPSHAWPCLLTATLRPDPKSATSLWDESVRARQYADALRWSARSRAFRSGLVLAENSGIRSPLVESCIDGLRARGKTVEFHDLRAVNPLPFQGKGWSEGAMIEHALAHSPLLAAHSAFFKITGRLRLVNHRAIAAAISRICERLPDVAFVAQSFEAAPRPTVGTQFFWSRRDFYQERLADAYRSTDDSAGFHLEHALGERLAGLAGGHPIYVLNLPVLIDGLNGWNGLPVQAKHFQWRLRMRRFLSRRPPLTPLSELIPRR